MKKAIATLLVSGLIQTMQAQGFVEFRNSGGFISSGDRLVYRAEVGGEKLVGTNYAAALYYTPPGATELILLPGAIRLFRVATTTLPGTWNPEPNPTVVFPDVSIGQFTTLQVRVWDIQRFSDWESAIAGGGEHGESEAFEYAVYPVNQPNIHALNGLRAFAMIPEPSVFTLSLLAVSALWLFRRPR